MGAETIFAVSSGSPPAAIAVMRVSGPRAMAAAAALTGRLPSPRFASLRTLRDRDGAPLDRALVLVFPGPDSATGEDLVELHLHGGRAVVAAVADALARLDGLRLALPGEFTRRALTNGRIDLTQAEGLADLLEAETESQRRAALAASEGALGAALSRWMRALSDAAALIEASIDYDGEEDVIAGRDDAWHAAVALVRDQMAALVAQPTVERLRDGLLVVLAGPPNAGKSSLFNAMLGREAAIVTPLAGTTRDVIEASVTRAGIPYRLCDTAGLAEGTTDVVEQIGIERARTLAGRADIILWLGDPDRAPVGAMRVGAKADLGETSGCDVEVSVFRAESIDVLWELLAERGRRSLTLTSDIALREGQLMAVSQMVHLLAHSIQQADLLVAAEQLRVARQLLGGLLGQDATEAMLDALFGRFCLGK
ncbi:tRNA uridine-5-carboxymethylaminomethyl(34) synthesis GTPase MnmE [Sphingomonas yunnanensis]|uniref:tRNA uridine-5-carboxymethylaminomethyl(34) synthesis GTPase MnmE n=1 Tax=Sphingomonas yunnanensis TaxID=310400 RepID=UPI001CA67A42|nr:tRNA uridine-5-carboxymethylaminomethyl(34) synthesis GTPase MnmE [Sphingomonas yunnanensis]